MRLITAHRILIVAAIAFSLVFATVEMVRYVKTGSTPLLIAAVLSVAAAVGLHLYFRTLARWGKR